jgi:hypothetical protein
MAAEEAAWRMVNEKAVLVMNLQDAVWKKALKRQSRG